MNAEQDLPRWSELDYDDYGRDRLVAETMGCMPVETDHGNEGFGYRAWTCGCENEAHKEEDYTMELKEYSTDATAALEFAEWFRSREHATAFLALYCHLASERLPIVVWECSVISGLRTCDVNALSPAEAICLAILRVLGKVQP